jgi:hypothetical protein
MEAGNSVGSKKRDTPARTTDEEAEGIRCWADSKGNQHVRHPAVFKLLSSLCPHLFLNV